MDNSECKFCGMPVGLCEEIFEMRVGGFCCGNCWYGETPNEKLIKKENNSYCDCSNGCYNCLDIEARSFN